jgi:hypothetical protein
MLAAMVADNVKAFGSIVTSGCLFRAAPGTPLRRHHIALVKHFLLFFGEEKDLLTLNTRNFDIRHRSSPPNF